MATTAQPWVSTADRSIASFCEAEYPRLVKVLGLLVGDVHLAEDLAQEALIRAWRRWDDVRGLDSPGGWVNRVAINLGLSALRSRRTRRRLDAVIEARPIEVSSDAGTANALAMRQAVAALPLREREAIVLRYFADYSVAETAGALRCPEGTVKTLTSRGIERLRAEGWAVED
jgi:RNA polymerase sigma-70 factor (ECF subfamily)